MAPLNKPYLIKYELDFNVYNFENRLFSIDVSSQKLPLQEYRKELSELNTFNPRETKISFRILIRERFQGYRCESCIAIFAWRVITLNNNLFK